MCRGFSRRPLTDEVITIEGVTTNFTYLYDATGRLYQVDLNGTPTTIPNTMSTVSPNPIAGTSGISSRTASSL
jgi:hypothetical protein